MGKVSKVEPHMTVERIQAKIRRTVGFWKVQKWLVILHATVDPKPARDITLHSGLAEQTVHKSTIYRLLSRHGWRKVVPRPTHVNADKNKQEEFKKLFSMK